jgi:hypothetical protein
MYWLKLSETFDSIFAVTFSILGSWRLFRSFMRLEWTELAALAQPFFERIKSGPRDCQQPTP